MGVLRTSAAVLALFVLLAAAPASRAHIINIPQIGDSTCAVCVNFVTTYDAPGPIAPVTLWHPNLVTNVPYAIDVDGGNSALPIGILPIVPGYELRVTVQAVSAEKPTITIQKLAGAPLVMPLRVELANGDPEGWTTLGYDTLATTAPQSFVAEVDLSDRDGIADTDQALVNVALTGAPPTLALVTEDFKGDPAGTRTDRAVRRLQFTGVPGRVGLDLTATPARQRLILTRDIATKLDFVVASAGDDPRTTGTIDQLPARIDVTLADTDVNGDGRLDKKIDYLATSAVTKALIRTRAGTQTTEAVIGDLPSEAHLTYASPPNRTEITYHANGRATSAHVDVTDPEQRLTADVTNLPANINELSQASQPGSSTVVYRSDGRASTARVFIEDRTEPEIDTLTAEVTNLPANITELTNTTRPDGGRLIYHADAPADLVTVATRKGDAKLDASVTGVPKDIDRLDHSSTSAQTALDYAAGAVVPLVTVRTEDLVGDAPDQHRRVVDTTIETLPPSVLLHIGKAGTIDYTAPGGIGKVHVLGTDEKPFFGRATAIDLLLTGLPDGADASFASDHMLFDARGGQIGLTQLLAHDGTPLTLPATEDGLLLRDLPADYNLFARVQNLRHFKFDKAATETAVAFDARSPSDRAIRVDSQRDVRHSLYFNETVQEDGTRVRRHVSRDGTETILGQLSNLPPDIHVSIGQDRGAKDILYTAEGAASFFSLNRKVAYRGDPIPVLHDDPFVAARLPDSYPPSDFDSEQDVDLFPVPVSFQLCRYSVTNDCTEDVFTDGMLEDYDSEEANKGSFRIRSTPRTNFSLLDLKTERSEFKWARDIDADPDCPPEQEVLFVCLGAGFKPVESESVVVGDVREFALQAAQDASGPVGHVIGKTSQGYLALDTGWAAESVPIAPGFHGHRPPPESARFDGRLTQFARDTRSERNADYGDFLGIGPAASSLNFRFQHDFAADHRVFEGDPDELIFAKHWHGHIRCGDAMVLDTGGTSFKDFMCDGEFILPAE